MIRRGEHDGGVAKPPTTIIVYEDSGSQASADAGGLSGETAAPPAHRDWGEQQVSGDTIASFFSAATRAPMGWGGAEGKGDSGDLTAQTFSGDTLASLFGSSSTQHEGAGGPGRGDIFEAFNPLGWFGPREQQAAAVQGGDGSGRLFEPFGLGASSPQAMGEDQGWLGDERVPESVRTRLSGVDVRVLSEEELEDLFASVGEHLQQAKESSLAKTGQVDGESVLWSVTAWELSFWEACEISKMRFERLSPEFIHSHLNEARVREPMEEREHHLAPNTALSCLVQGVPFYMNSFESQQNQNFADDAVRGMASARMEKDDPNGFELVDSDNFWQDTRPGMHAGVLASGPEAARTVPLSTASPVHATRDLKTADLTPIERMQAMLKNKSMTVKQKLDFSRRFANTHTDWEDVKTFLQGTNPLVCESFKGNPVYQTDLKRMSASEIKEVMMWRAVELKRHESKVFVCVGRHLPIHYQRCIKRLPHHVQNEIEKKLLKVQSHGSTALDLRAAAMCIINNGGGYSAAKELKIEMEEPVESDPVPTPSQMVEIRRTQMMKEFREGTIDVQDMMHRDFNLTTGSTRARSVTGGRSKLDTPAKDALITPKYTVDLYNARYLGDDNESMMGSEFARPVDTKSVVSSKLESAGRSIAKKGGVENRSSRIVQRQPVKNFELTRVEIFKQLLERKFDRRTQVDLQQQEVLMRQRLKDVGFDDEAERKRLEKFQSRAKLGGEDIRFAQAIPAQHRDPYAYGGIDGKTQEPIIGWQDGASSEMLRSCKGNACMHATLTRGANRAAVHQQLQQQCSHHGITSQGLRGGNMPGILTFCDSGQVTPSGKGPCCVNLGLYFATSRRWLLIFHFHKCFDATNVAARSAFRAAAMRVQA